MSLFASAETRPVRGISAQPGKFIGASLISTSEGVFLRGIVHTFLLVGLRSFAAHDSPLRTLLLPSTHGELRLLQLSYTSTNTPWTLERARLNFGATSRAGTAGLFVNANGTSATSQIMVFFSLKNKSAPPCMIMTNQKSVPIAHYQKEIAHWDVGQAHVFVEDTTPCGLCGLQMGAKSYKAGQKWCNGPTS